MANFWYTNALRAMQAGEINLASDDIRVIYCMTNTTADTEEDVTTVSGFTTLDEYDGSGAPSTFGGRQALAGEAVTAENGTNQGKFTANNLSLTGIGAGTRANQSLVVYKHGTSDSDSVPLIHLDCSFSFTGTGDVSVTVNANGLGTLDG